jgi:hypothetical protein
LSDLVPGSYNVKISIRDYNTYSTTATVVAGQTTTVNAALSKKSTR